MARRKKKNILELFVEVVILAILIPIFYGLSIFAFFGYLFAIAGSVYTGVLFRKRNIARLIVFGSIITYIAGIIIIYALKQSELIVLVIMILFGLYIWYKGSVMKKGR